MSASLAMYSATVSLIGVCGCMEAMKRWNWWNSAGRLNEKKHRCAEALATASGGYRPAPGSVF